MQFDADAWVKTAKDAGMKYIIITSKHHDGFANFDSKVSTYDIVDATPYHRDAIKALASAAHRAGLRFGVYYSIMDWHHPDAQAGAYPDYNSGSFHSPNFARYVETYMKPQLRELVTQYPEIDVLWFDGEWVADWSDEQGQALYDWLHTMRPSLIINNRVGHSRQGMAGMSANKDAPGDFGTPEQQVPATGTAGRGLGDVHDAQRHVGLPVVRRRLEGHEDARADARGRRVEGREPAAQRRTRRRRA